MLSIRPRIRTAEGPGLRDPSLIASAIEPRFWGLPRVQANEDWHHVEVRSKHPFHYSPVKPLWDKDGQGKTSAIGYHRFFLLPGIVVRVTGLLVTLKRHPVLGRHVVDRTHLASQKTNERRYADYDSD